MRNDYCSNYLSHHGILGQKWGHKNGPPYPLDAKDHSSSEKKAGWIKSLKAKSEAKKKEKTQKANLEKARKAKIEKKKQEQLKAEYEADKQKVLQSGKASEVLKYKGQMTNKELMDAVQRIEWEKKLSALSAQEVKSNWDKMDNLMDKVGKVTGYVNKGVDAYNAINKALNIFNPKEDKGGGGSDKNKDSNPLQSVIDSGNLKEIKKYQKQLSNKDLITALNRVENNKKLDKALSDEKEAKREAKAEKKLAKEAKRAEKDEKRKKIWDDFYDGAEWPDDDDEDDERRRT